MPGKGKGKGKTAPVLRGKKRSGIRDKTGSKTSIHRGAIRRMCRRAGVKRLSSKIYAPIQNAGDAFLNRVMKDAMTYAEHARRKTVVAMDVIYALKRLGRNQYGFNPA